MCGALYLSSLGRNQELQIKSAHAAALLDPLLRGGFVAQSAT